VLADASRTFPNDTDLHYEEAMLHEKLDRLDDMERLLAASSRSSPTTSTRTTRSATRSPSATCAC
jgi:hypothetical protein